MILAACTGGGNGASAGAAQIAINSQASLSKVVSGGAHGAATTVAAASASEPTAAAAATDASGASATGSAASGTISNSASSSNPAAKPAVGPSSASGAPVGGSPSSSQGTPASGNSSGSGGSATAEKLFGDTNRPNNSTFALGETVAVTFQASGLAASKTTSIAIKVSDEFGNQISWSSLSITADASGNASAIFAAPASKFGYYQVEGSLPDGTGVPGLGTRPAGFVTYAVVPDPAKRTNYGDSGSRFGMQGGFSYAQGNVLPYLGIRYLLDGPAWRSLEPDYAGQFAAARSAATAKGQIYPAPVADNGASWPTYAIPLVTTANGLPTWAMEPGTGTKSWPAMGILNSAGDEALPVFAKALAEEVATDYAGQSAHYYQMTWEPEIPSGFGGSPEQLVQLYKLSYDAIHQADPKAIVMGPTLFPGDVTLMNQLWTANLGAYVDAVSMHPYVAFPPENNGLVSNIRLQMKMAQTAKGHSIPFVGTEHGYASGVIGELDEALGNIRETIILLGEGFKFDFAFYIADFWDHDASETGNTFGYYWNLDPNIDFGTDKLGPKPVAPAFAAMTFWLDGTTTNGPISNLSATQMGYRFQRNGVIILALWDYQAASSSINLPMLSGSVQICDWMGNCTTTEVNAGSLKLSLGSSPTYVIGQGL